MKSISILFVCFIAIVHATSIRDNIEPLSEKHVEYINQLNTTWKAASNFRGYKIQELKGLFGSLLDDNEIETIDKDFHVDLDDLPDNFDSRQNWPECRDVISHIRDQGSCGSCWAVASASAITDRVCIASKGKNQTQYSAQTLASCCNECYMSEGCQGGWPLMAFDYWVNSGLPSGGDYGDQNTCDPYLVPPCEHHVEGSRPKCGDIVKTPKCNRKCTNDGVSSERNHGKSFRRLNKNTNLIKKELYAHGSMTASFVVYDDFLLYKEGIYQTTKGAKAQGGHAIVVIGWGIDKQTNTEYWLAKNNWNTDWGENGYFKIKMGEAKIDNNFVAGIARD